MDGKKHHQSQKKYKFLKRTVQFVISLSVFSFFVWYSSGFSILPQSFNAYFSTFPFSMLTRTLERKYMFLICNAILALLAKSSVLTSSSPPMSPFDLEFQVSTNTKAQVSDVAVFPVGSFRCLENAPLIAEEEIGQVKKQEECYGQVLEAEGEEARCLWEGWKKQMKKEGQEMGLW
ncbi:uncharacterized protein LOC113874627 [Abrus precatorius]|uniref:Uncharacterized protein LOC113874627 n=1 Tax=Abrus precatorius TaxID=3816 RepID=A0A8B8MN31_ABRPR|nr:uncharacterized protein LOC113874627 [Abrus precatorius]